ncbi:MAG: hypothetical protein ACYC5O_15140 [Anaerolineae bacterium]
MAETPLRRRTLQALIAHALLRWESAVTIALAIVAIGLFPRPFPFWQWWYWLVLFLAAEVLIIWTSLNDQRTGERVVAEMLRQRYSPGSIRQVRLRGQVDKAIEYRQGIERQIAQTRPGVLRDRLLTIANRVDEWMAQIVGLAQRLDRLSSDDLIQRDARATPEEIAQYRRRLTQAQDEGMRQQLQMVLASKETQLANLRQLARSMESGQLQLDNTVSDLGTLYSQFVLLEARDVESGRVQRLSQDIDDEIASLADVVSTLDELYKKSAEA